MNLYLRTLAVISVALFTQAALAGRPLATDDAATAELKTCQLEGWANKSGSARQYVLAPACGVAKGVEIGADITRDSPRGGVIAAFGVSAKWVPAEAKLTTPVGEINFGMKLAAGASRLAGGGWQHNAVTVLGLASLDLGSGVQVHVDVGATRDRAAQVNAALLNAAAVWNVSEHGLLFAEALSNNRSSVLGSTVKTLGGRYWLVKDSLGLDLTYSRQAGSTAQWGLGFGWYGLGF